MSNKALIEKFQRNIGHAIDWFCVELWRFDTETSAQPVGIGIQFRDGPSFRLSCAGDGGVGIHKDRWQTSYDNFQVRFLDELTGEVLESIKFWHDRIVLSTTGHCINIVNRDDELEITVNDKNINEILPRL